VPLKRRGGGGGGNPLRKKREWLGAQRVKEEMKVFDSNPDKRFQNVSRGGVISKKNSYKG